MAPADLLPTSAPKSAYDGVNPWSHDLAPAIHHGALFQPSSNILWLPLAQVKRLPPRSTTTSLLARRARQRAVDRPGQLFKARVRRTTDHCPASSTWAHFAAQVDEAGHLGEHVHPPRPPPPLPRRAVAFWAGSGAGGVLVGGGAGHKRRRVNTRRSEVTAQKKNLVFSSFLELF